MASEFSYTPSEDLNTSESPDKRQPSSASHISSSSKGSRSSGSKGKDPFSDFRAPAKNPGRDSYMSSLSEYSTRDRDVAEPVTVTRVERDLGEVNRVDLQASNSIKLGKLPTVKGHPAQRLPDMSYSTNVEAPVPPRLARRPKSAVYSHDFQLPVSPTQKELAKIGGKNLGGHAHLHSITDDLEQLMASASAAGNSVGGESANDGGVGPADDSSSRYSDNKRDLSASSGDQMSQLGPQGTPQMALADNERFLPPRPSPSDVERARVVSQEIRHKQETFAPVSGEEGLEGIESGMRELATSSGHEGVLGGYDDHLHNRALGQDVGGSAHSQIDPDFVSGTAANAVDPHMQQASLSHQSNRQQYHPSAPSTENMERNFSGPVQPTDQPRTSNEPNALQEAHAAQLISPQVSGSEAKRRSRKSPSHPYRQSLSSSNTDMAPYPQTDEFYDIEEPVVVKPPVRAKSVKDSTHNLIKNKKKKSRSRVKSHQSKSHLKPFTYSTLISLLESTNGTVIGEEFTQLNLPIRQKQLVEKIVDLLSRLTLDMLVDEQRYEVGLRRMELALRVLEGFM